MNCIIMFITIEYNTKVIMNYTIYRKEKLD